MNIFFRYGAKNFTDILRQNWACVFTVLLSSWAVLITATTCDKRERSRKKNNNKQTKTTNTQSNTHTLSLSQARPPPWAGPMPLKWFAQCSHFLNTQARAHDQHAPLLSDSPARKWHRTVTAHNCFLSLSLLVSRFTDVHFNMVCMNIHVLSIL